MKRLGKISYLLLCVLLFSGCTAPEAAPSDTPQSVSSESLEELETQYKRELTELRLQLTETQTQLETARMELERLTDPEAYSPYCMDFTQPENSQVIVNCLDGIRLSPIGPGSRCGHRMENEYAEVLAKCTIKAWSAYTQPPEEWLLIVCAPQEAAEGSLGWIPAECAAAYTAENMETAVWPMKVDQSVVEWRYGFVAFSAIEDGMARVGYHGGGSDLLPLESILRPEPGVTGWFN